MDKDDLVQLITAGTQAEMFQGAWAIVEAALKQVTAETGEAQTLTQDESDAVDLGIHAGINSACAYMIKYKLLPGGIST